MNCPVCKRSLAPTLSICPTCGAMMNDTVREELQTKITAGPSVFADSRTVRPPTPAPARPVQYSPVKQPQPPQKRINTSGLAPSKTSPTLIEFQNRNRAVPDWRLQLQNAVQQRKGGQSTSGDRQPLAATDPVRDARAASVAIAEGGENIDDPRVANAMRRIAESRRAFLEPEPAPKRSTGVKAEQPRPFGVVPASGDGQKGVGYSSVPAARKPTLVSAPPVLKRDTNKLPRIEIAAPKSVEVENGKPVLDIEPTDLHSNAAEIKRISITVEKNEVQEPGWPVEEIEEIEDLAPISMRFGAGLFDLIIGTFASMLLLSPLVFAGVEWASWAGLLTLAGTAAVVLFIYMTGSLGFFGKTVGMKLFSLELVDAVDNEYPTLRQSAVNSSLFLLSLVFAGAGFLTMIFNEEKRAIHDLISGTILVREF